MAATSEPTPTTSTEIDVLVSKAVAQVKAGSITLADLMKALTPQQVSAEVPVVIPTAKEITTAQRNAVDRLPEVYGKVVPTERRALAPTEVSALVTEKQTLDEVKKMAEARLKDVTQTIHNHLDVAYEATTPEAERVIRDESGHYILKGRVGGPDREQEFSRETREGSTTLSLADLEALDTGEPDALITHAEFLAMTRQVRVIDEARVMDAVSKNPALVRALAKASLPGKTGTSVYLRKKV